GGAWVLSGRASGRSHLLADHHGEVAAQPSSSPIRSTSTRAKGWSWYWAYLAASRVDRADTISGPGRSSQCRWARTHHSRDQSAGSQCSMSSTARGSAARFRSRGVVAEALGVTRSIGIPTYSPCTAYTTGTAS